jgi:hypothetical protein
MFARTIAPSLPCDACRRAGRTTRDGKPVRKLQIPAPTGFGRIVDACPYCDNPPQQVSR